MPSGLLVIFLIKWLFLSSHLPKKYLHIMTRHMYTETQILDWLDRLVTSTGQFLLAAQLSNSIVSVQTGARKPDFRISDQVIPNQRVDKLLNSVGFFYTFCPLHAVI